MKSLERMADVRIWMVVSSLVMVFASQAPQSQEAPTGFDGKSNGLVDDQTHQEDQVKFDEVEGVAEGLGVPPGSERTVSRMRRPATSPSRMGRSACLIHRQPAPPPPGS